METDFGIISGDSDGQAQGTAPTEPIAPGDHAHVHEHHHAVINRLARLEGHVRAIKRMVEEGTACPEVLIQIAAVRSALDHVGRIILEDHIKSCMVNAIRTGDFENAYQDLERSLKRFIG